MLEGPAQVSTSTHPDPSSNPPTRCRPQVKNKQPANRQITAEQILRESKEIQLEDGFSAPRTIITDPEELAEYRLRKRKECEDLVRRVGRFNASAWLKVGGAGLRG